MLFTDNNPHRDTPYLTYGLMAIEFLLCVWIICDPVDHFAYLQISLPYKRGISSYSNLLLCFITQFIAHIYALYVFSDNVEYAMGRIRFILFVLCSGIITTFGQSMLYPIGTGVQVGFSGIIAAIISAYARIYPDEEIELVTYPWHLWRHFYPDDWFVYSVRWLVFAFFIFNLWAGYNSLYHDTYVSFWAQIIGFIFGFVVAPIFRDPSIVLKAYTGQPIPYAQNHWDYIAKMKKAGRPKDPKYGVAGPAPVQDKIQVTDDFISF